MPDGEVVWVRAPNGHVRGFHEPCARWLDLSSLEVADVGRAPYHTEICRGCGGFLIGPAPEHHAGHAQIDVDSLLN